MAGNPFAFLTSCRFFGNRSYCYYCLEQYPQALADAERSIQLAPDWPKGHFRKGSALMGMKVGTGYCALGILHVIVEMSVEVSHLSGCGDISQCVGFLCVAVQRGRKGYGAGAETGQRL